MKLHAVTFLLAVLSMRCRAEISFGGKSTVGGGVPLSKVANYTVLASRLYQLSPAMTSEINVYVDEHSNTTNSTSYDFYIWYKYDSTNALAVAVVCPSNNADEGECAAVAQYNDELCKSASVCPFEPGTEKKEVTADCEGINADLPSCSYTCSTFESDSDAFDTCVASSLESPTSAPIGPTSFAPATYTKFSSVYALPFLVGATWMLGP